MQCDERVSPQIWSQSTLPSLAPERVHCDRLLIAPDVLVTLATAVHLKSRTDTSHLLPSA